VSTFDFGTGLLVLAAVVGVVNDRTLRLPRPVALLLASFPEITPSGMRCTLLPISAATPRIPISASPAEQGAGARAHRVVTPAAGARLGVAAYVAGRGGAGRVLGGTFERRAGRATPPRSR
jgi:hypothetical protein